ncbi:MULTISPECIES: YybH family protein [unclassified Sphingomonas]|uniref:YybH family protein n=1 Tax=unclassified Sphingomonas TaxID=196159 RepID=UPI000AA0A918|nr:MULTISPECIES: nuclear transport factor 2 family protein [unclassified Sphingomonas]
MAATPAETAIRRVREESNRRIAAHDADGAVALMQEGVLVIPSGGGPLAGRAAVRAVLAASFADPGFRTYERLPDRIEVAPDGATAAESGRWRGLWKADSGHPTLKGGYTARWRLDGGRWTILSEIFEPDPA